MKAIDLLGGMTAETFLQDYWHKKPLLIRNAIPGFSAPLPRQELFDLARRDDVDRPGSHESAMCGHRRNLGDHALAGQGIANEDDTPLVAADGLTAMSHRGDVEPDALSDIHGATRSNHRSMGARPAERPRRS